MKVKINNDKCWEWNGATNEHGYGIISIKPLSNSPMKAHRFSWEFHNKKEIPDGMCVLHHCDNPECVNPKHLFIGTMKDNTQDMLRKGRHYAPGAKNPNSKLNSIDIIEIRHLYNTGGYSSRTLGKLFQVTKDTIMDVVTRKTWKRIYTS